MGWLTDCQHHRVCSHWLSWCGQCLTWGKGWILHDSSHEDFGRERAIYFCSSEAKLLLLITAHSPKVMEWGWDLVLWFLYWSLGAIKAIKFSSVGECVIEDPKPFLQNSNCFDFWVLHVALIVHTGGYLIVCALWKLVLSKKEGLTAVILKASSGLLKYFHSWWELQLNLLMWWDIKNIRGLQQVFKGLKVLILQIHNHIGKVLHYSKLEVW